MSEGIPCIWMRGGTSKGAYFSAADLPREQEARDAVLLRIMGSPDPLQIDGIGGADPLCSKVAILSPSDRDDADVNYLFLQVFVDQPIVSAAQACGNILAGVGPAAIEMSMIKVHDAQTRVRIFMENTGEVAEAVIQTPDGKVTYEGTASIDGVPKTHAPVELMFSGLEGSMCGSLLPSGNVIDLIDGVACTLIDNGMPIVVMRADGFGLSGQEGREELEADTGLKAKIESIRRQAGQLMGLGDVTDKSVPKMTLVSAPQHGGVINTRSFIPHRCHASIGVFAAVSVATACTLKGSPAYDLAEMPDGDIFSIEHPTGAAEVLIKRNKDGCVIGAGTLRTARKLFEGKVFP